MSGAVADRPARIDVRRVREPRGDEGLRVLVDRLWPRGVSKGDADLDLWPKALTPSTELRTALHGDAISWAQFETRYRRELAADTAEPALAELVDAVAAESRPVAFLVSGRADGDTHAGVLRDVVLDALTRRASAGERR